MTALGTKTVHKPQAPLQLDAAYAVCRSISRAAAKNFYYAFLALPRPKRDALCALYAFMRQSDDICDNNEPGVTVGEKRERLQRWVDSMHRALDGQRTDDPVLMALADTQRRFNILPGLLDALVQGTAMDLQDCIPPKQVPRALAAEPPVVLYRNFDDLYGYCYHVASVVGLACIRIFGYRDPAAEPLAERCGIAFQLTNIIRDVKEDAEMGRVYFPQEDLDHFGRNATELTSGITAERFQPLLEFEAQRAREFYKSAEELIPLVDEDSQPALWALVEIYRRLLEKIASRNFKVFGDEKIRLTTIEKLSVLAKGIWRRLI